MHNNSPFKLTSRSAVKIRANNTEMQKSMFEENNEEEEDETLRTKKKEEGSNLCTGYLVGTAGKPVWAANNLKSMRSRI